MKFSKIAVLLIIALMPMAAFSTQHDAAGSALTCSDLQFSSQILNALPEANSACRKVVMKNGEAFASFYAEIVRNRAGTIRAKFQRADSSWTNVYEFSPDPSARVHVQGRSFLWRDMQRGQQLDIYLPQDRFEIATHMEEVPLEEAVVVTTIILVAAPAEAEPLPTTASIVPLVGALGGLFVVLGAGLGMIRRRIRKS